MIDTQLNVISAACEANSQLLILNQNGQQFIFPSGDSVDYFMVKTIGDEEFDLTKATVVKELIEANLNEEGFLVELTENNLSATGFDIHECKKVYDDLLGLQYALENNLTVPLYDLRHPESLELNLTPQLYYLWFLYVKYTGFRTLCGGLRLAISSGDKQGEYKLKLITREGETGDYKLSANGYCNTLNLRGIGFDTDISFKERI